MPLVADIYYYLYDDGEAETPPVVLIHGAGGTYLNWHADVRRLSGFRVYAIDLPGHGKSGGRGRQTIQAYAKCVLDWVDAVGLYKAVFVGHSMGGAIALILGEKFPEHVSGLGLVSTGARLRVAPVIIEYAANSATFPAAVEAITSWAFSPQADARMVELAAQRLAETRASVFHGDFLACDAFDIRDSLPELNVPTIVICGQDDKLTPPRYSQYLADQIPTAQLEVIPDAGHMVMLEKPQSVANALTTFLHKIPYQPG